MLELGLDGKDDSCGATSFQRCSGYKMLFDIDNMTKSHVRKMVKTYSTIQMFFSLNVLHCLFKMLVFSSRCEFYRDRLAKRRWVSGYDLKMLKRMLGFKYDIKSNTTKLEFIMIYCI